MILMVRKSMMALSTLWMILAVGCGAHPLSVNHHGVQIRQRFDAGALGVRAYDDGMTDESQGLWGLAKNVRLEIESSSDQVTEVTLLNEVPLFLFEVRSARGETCTHLGCETDQRTVCRVENQIFPECLLKIRPGKNTFHVQGDSAASTSRLELMLHEPSVWREMKSLREGLLVFCLSALLSVLIYQMGLLIVESRTFILAHIWAGWSFLGIFVGMSGVLFRVSPTMQLIATRCSGVFAGCAVIATWLEVVFYLKDFFPTRRGNVALQAVRFFMTHKTSSRLGFSEVFAVVLPSLVLCATLSYYAAIYTGILPFEYWSRIAAIVFVFLYSLLMSVVFGVLAGEWRMKVIKTEQALELGRNVQDLLIEPSGRSIQDGWDLVVGYQPHLGRMSGDWIMRWETPDGSQHLLFGDVTGKGPQAALTVAMVASVVNSQARNLATAKHCIEELNKALFHACQGAVSTTASGVTYEKSGHVTLINCGGPGWMVIKSGKSEHWLGRGGILGLLPTLPIAYKDYHLLSGDIALGMTDGLASSLREMRHVAQLLEQVVGATNDLQEISRMIMTRPAVDLIADDKAMICLGKVG